MTARSGMLNLIQELRAMTNAGTADYTIAGVSYWTDDQLQTILDRRRTEVIEDALYPVHENHGGTLVTYRYYSTYGQYERTTGGTAIFVVRDNGWNVVGTALYTPDYERGEITFASNTDGLAYFVTGRSYDLNAAAADVWDRKAGQAASAAFSWQTDNMRVDRTKLRAEAVEMAQYYRALAGPSSLNMTREDC